MIDKPNLTAIVGVHDSRIGPWFQMLLNARGYDVTVVGTMDDMRRLVGDKEHQVYMMDLNLGFSGIEDISPATEIYDMVRTRVEQKHAVFLGFSYNRITVENAHKADIPACLTDELNPPNHDKNLDMYLEDPVLD